MTEPTSTARTAGRLRLGYATNAFPGESAGELLALIEGPLARIRLRLSDLCFPGLELRMGLTTAEELEADPELLSRLAGALAKEKLSVLTMNAFSPKGFHARRVKEDAYRPTWGEPERLEYTRKIAGLFARLLPSGSLGAVSTSPGSFKGFGHDDHILDTVARAYADAALSLAEIEERTGSCLLLSVEPEPGCTIETTAELVDFYQERILALGVDRIVEASGRSRSDCEGILRRHVGATFDAAHQAVEFEDPVESLTMLEKAGMRVGKIHATSALRLRRPGRNREALRRLERYAHSPYMHQVIGVDESGSICVRAKDLGALLAHPDALDPCAEIRIHFHLPLFLDSLGPLETTSREACEAVRFAASRGLCEVAVLETYTWNVLSMTPELGGMDIEEGIAREIEWARRNLPAV
ncbi:MAG TPA: metabolite traffic protein EboE [Spirochaetia bacterium]|nr:metabolite traffic protein EboE [Spirochaetia bacterium]